MTAPLLVRLGAQDRALMLRCAISPAAPRASRLGWSAITHLGGTGVSVTAAGLPWLGCCEVRHAAELAMATRVRLGVHYPSDVLVGQLIAIGTAIAVIGLL